MSAAASAPKVAQSPVNPSQDNRLYEWNAARAVIERFDGYLTDLRRYGFTLTTSLLSITGLFSSSPAVGFPPEAKFGVVSSIMVLVVALYFLDANYRYIQRGAVVRARILERALNLDLTSTIEYVLKVSRFEPYFTSVYVGFATSTYVLGVAVLWGSPFLELVLIDVFAGAIVAIYLLSPGQLKGLMDWSVDRKVAVAGQPIRITFTSLTSSRDELIHNVRETSNSPNLSPRLREALGRIADCLESPQTEICLTALAQVEGPLYTVKIGQEGRSPNLGKAIFSPQDLQLEYMAQANWVWDTSGSQPGLYVLKGGLNVLLTPAGTRDKPEFGAGTYELAIQILEADSGVSQVEAPKHPDKGS